MNPTILITGRNGQLGFELHRSLAGLGVVHATGRGDLDLSDVDGIRRYMRELRPAIVVNAGAYTNVDRAENDRNTVNLINGTVPGVLAEELGRAGGKLLIHYSTDYVFNGGAHLPYKEEDPTDPVNAYGESKLAGERAVQNAGIPYMIIRTEWVYATRGKNFLLTVLRLAREGKPLRIVSDQFGSPTWARMLAEATAQMMSRYLYSMAEEASGWEGIYHLTSAGQTSWHGFARAILQDLINRFESVGHAPKWCTTALDEVVPITTSEYLTPARRPAFSLLSNEKVSRKFGIRLPDWRDQLRMAVEDFHIPE